MRKVLTIIADTHVGHPFALPGTADGWETVDGNFIANNEFQDELFRFWLESGRWVADLRRHAELIVVHAGDANEGVHHGTVQLVTQRVDEQERMFVTAQREWLAAAKFNPRRDRQLFLHGTAPAHAGIGNSSTERIARALLGTDDLDGTVILPRLYKTVNGVLFDIAHKGYRLGGREWTRTNAMRAYLQSRWITALKAGQPLPRYFVRAHNHTFGYAALEDDDGATLSEGFLMPAWKLKDEYVYSLAPEAVSSIGVLAFTLEPDGSSRAHKLLMRLAQERIEEL